MVLPYSILAQGISIISPVEHSMAGLTALSDDGYPALYNPSSIRSRMAFICLGTLYRGTGTYIISMGGSVLFRHTGMALGASYTGDAIYKQWSFSFSSSLELGIFRLGIGTANHISSFLGELKDSKNMLLAGFQTSAERPWVAGGYIRTVLFRGAPVIQYMVAAGYRIHPMLKLYIQGSWEKGYRSIVRLAGALKINSRFQLRFGAILTALTASIGGNCTFQNLRFCISLAYHAYLGAQSITGISHEFSAYVPD